MGFGLYTIWVTTLHITVKRIDLSKTWDTYWEQCQLCHSPSYFLGIEITYPNFFYLLNIKMSSHGLYKICFSTNRDNSVLNRLSWSDYLKSLHFVWKNLKGSPFMVCKYSPPRGCIFLIPLTPEPKLFQWGKKHFALRITHI